MHKKLKLKYTIFKDLYLLLSKVIGKKEIRIYVNTLHYLFRVNYRNTIVNILINLKNAIEEDKKLYTSKGKKLIDIKDSASNKSLANINSVVEIKEVKANIISNVIKIELNNILFKIEEYEEYKNIFSEKDYQNLIIILDIVIKETNQNRFKNDVLKAIKNMTELSNLNLAELKLLINRVEIWVSSECKLKNKAYYGGWAYIIDVVRLKNSKITDSGALPMTTQNLLGLYIVKKSIINAIKLGYSNIVIYTDSKYAFNVCSKWMALWKKNGWLTKENKLPAHLELVKELYGMFTKKGNNITIVLIDPVWKLPLYKKVVSLATKESNKKKGRLNKLEKENPKHLDFQDYIYLRRKILNK